MYHVYYSSSLAIQKAITKFNLPTIKDRLDILNSNFFRNIVDNDSHRLHYFLPKPHAVKRTLRSTSKYEPPQCSTIYLKPVLFNMLFLTTSNKLYTYIHTGISFICICLFVHIIYVVSMLNKELTNVSDWLKVNKLSLNVVKTKYMIFHSHKRKVESLQLIINNTEIERVQELNFLGLTLDEHLNWNSHINKISSKVSKNIGILNKLKHFLPLKTKILIYNSLIVSHLNFGILAWGYQCDGINEL